MPWSEGGAACGFSSAEPWLPIPARHRASAVSRQLADRHSVLNAYRTFLRWRREHPALRYGDIRFVDSPPDTLCFVREHADESLLACFNFSSSACNLSWSGLGRVEPLAGHGFDPCALARGRVGIPALGAFFGCVKC